VFSLRILAVGTGLLLSALVLARPVHGQLQAGPTLLEIGPDATATRLVLSNATPRPVTAQVRVFAWIQPDGEDELVPSDDLAVSPPIVELAPGAEQIVRLVRLGPPAQGRDLTYRVVVDELPQTEETDHSQINLRMRYVIPAFVRAAEAAAPSLSCRIEAGGRQLTCENSGGRAAQLGASSLLDDHGEVSVLSAGLFGYVLPGSRRVWPLPADEPGPNGLQGPTLRLDTRLNGRPTTIPVHRAP
jgi:fimbrial chaperone protein